MTKLSNAVVKGALSVMSPEQKHRFIMSVIDKGVEIINADSSIDVKKIRDDYACGEERSILLVVRNCLPLGALFVLSDKGLRRESANSRRATVTVVIGEDDFINVAKGKSSIEEVALTSLEADIIGDYIVRDFFVLRRLFRVFGHVIVSLAEE